MTSPPPHLLLFKNFFANRNFLKNRTEGFPNQFFSALWHKNFDRQPWNSSLPPFHPETFSLRDFFSNTAQRGNPTKSFDIARLKSFYRKSWHTPLSRKNYPHPKLVTNWRVNLRSFLALWDEKNSTENLDIPPLLSINFFVNGSFTKRSTEG